MLLRRHWRILSPRSSLLFASFAGHDGLWLCSYNCTVLSNTFQRRGYPREIASVSAGTLPKRITPSPSRVRKAMQTNYAVSKQNTMCWERIAAGTVKQTPRQRINAKAKVNRRSPNFRARFLNDCTVLYVRTGLVSHVLSRY